MRNMVLSPAVTSVWERCLSYIWLLPIIGAGAYREIIGLYVALIKATTTESETGFSLINAVGAALTLGVLFAVPLFALFILIKYSTHPVLGGRSIRRALYLVCTVSALGGPIGHILAALGLSQWQQPLWWALWALIALWLFFGRHPAPLVVREEAAPGWLRMSHGIMAALLLSGFLIFHMVNHLGALWSVALHGEIATVLRLWYQSPWVEPFLLLIILFMIVSGIAMVVHYTRFQTDAFRTVQMACGVYLAAFFGSHVPTVLRSRAMEMKTDWFFAVSENGLLDPSRAMLTPYYILSVCALMIHVFLGVRTVLLAHHVEMAAANRIFYRCTYVGLVGVVLITAAMFNLHIR